MVKITGYINDYLRSASVAVHGCSMLLLAAVVWANYSFGINSLIQRQSFFIAFSCWYALLLVVYAIPFVLYTLQKQHRCLITRPAIFFIFIAPAIFSWKMAAPMAPFAAAANSDFWNGVVYYPAKAAVVTSLICLTGLLLGSGKNSFGLNNSGGSLKPYWVMLLLMVPLVIAAATRPHFLQVYPKALQVQSGPLSLAQVLLFEVAYGIDFFTIEVFFRGFLVVYASRWLGAGAILPMAMFYCVIHFGKPLGECISSFFGGMLLGIVSYHSRSVWGGLLVHVGIAWMMEVAAFLFR